MPSKSSSGRVSLCLISDAPSLIQALLKDNNDAPFLYEKIGTRIEHHMIDEFQDTSRMQYENFKPLLDNAQSQGQDCSSSVMPSRVSTASVTPTAPY